jgi:hypothetical protein
MPGTRLRACRARGKNRKQLIKLLVLICLDDESLVQCDWFLYDLPKLSYSIYRKVPVTWAWWSDIYFSFWWLQLENRVSPLHAFLKDRAHHDLILDVCIFSLYFYASILYFLFWLIYLLETKRIIVKESHSCWIKSPADILLLSDS